MKLVAGGRNGELKDIVIRNENGFVDLHIIIDEYFEDAFEELEVDNKQQSIWLESNDAGEMVVNGTTYKLKRVGNDIEVYDGSKQLDIIRGVVNYNDRFIRENELVARMDKDPSMQTKFDNRRAFYRSMNKFIKCANDGMSYKQALKSVVEEGRFDDSGSVSYFSDMLKDNGYHIVLTANDKHWIKRAIRRKGSDLYTC